MPLGRREAGNYKPRLMKMTFLHKCYCQRVKRMIYLLVMKNKQEIKGVRISTPN